MLYMTIKYLGENGNRRYKRCECTSTACIAAALCANGKWRVKSLCFNTPHTTTTRFIRARAVQAPRSNPPADPPRAYTCTHITLLQSLHVLNFLLLKAPAINIQKDIFLLFLK